MIRPNQALQQTGHANDAGSCYYANFRVSRLLSWLFGLISVCCPEEIMSLTPVEVAPQRREFLALKGRLLYGKYCGTEGQGICAESFALYHLQLGESEIVLEFLAFLEQQLVALRGADPHRRLAMTERLVARIRSHVQSV